MASLRTIRCVRLYILQNGNKESIDELANRFGVTRRQIFRDLALLRTAEEGFELPARPNTDGAPGPLHDDNGSTVEPRQRGMQERRDRKASRRAPASETLAVHERSPPRQRGCRR